MKIRLGPYDRKWSLKVRQRDDYTCQVCGYYDTHYVAAHHIIRRGIKPTRLVVENGISLCAEHHVFSHEFSAHKTPEAFRRWFIEKFPKRWEMIDLKQRQHMTEREAIAEFKEIYESTDA